MESLGGNQTRDHKDGGKDNAFQVGKISTVMADVVMTAASETGYGEK